MVKMLKDVAKNAVLNFLTIIPAFIVGMFLITDDSEFGIAIGLIIFVFVIALVIQSVLLAIFRSHRHWVNSLIAMTVMLLTGLLFLDAMVDEETRSVFAETEAALLLNISTEFLGAALIVVLLQFKRLGVAGAMVIGVVVLHLVDTETGLNADVYINLASEIFGALLTGWVIHRVIELRDQVNEKQKISD